MKTMNLDLFYTLVLIGIAALLTLVYGLRVAVKGRAQFDRIDKQGESALMKKGMMEMAYWTLQPVARLLVFFRLSANAISCISLFLGFLSGACLAFGHFGFGAIFSTFSALLDSLDGMVARLTGTSSDAGEVLDAAVDRYNEFFFIGGLLIYYRSIPALMILAFLALVGSFMISYSSAKAEALHVDVPKGSMRRPERAFYLTLGAALSPITIPWFELERTYEISLGHPMIMALGLVAVLANFSAVERFVAIAKAIRQRELVERVAREILQAEEAHGVTPASADANHPIKVQ